MYRSPTPLENLELRRGLLEGLGATKPLFDIVVEAYMQEGSMEAVAGCLNVHRATLYSWCVIRGFTAADVRREASRRQSAQVPA